MKFTSVNLTFKIYLKKYHTQNYDNNNDKDDDNRNNWEANWNRIRKTEFKASLLAGLIGLSRLLLVSSWRVSHRKD